jgi:Periplasmic binding protein
MGTITSNCEAYCVSHDGSTIGHESPRARGAPRNDRSKRGEIFHNRLPRIIDDDQVVVSAHFYSADHDSPANKAFVAAFKQANGGLRPNFMAVSAYDGMNLIYETLKKTVGKTDGDSLIAAAKGMAWESPRGPVSIDPDTRDIVQNVYIRKVEKKNGELYNVEFATFANVKDPIKAAEAK